MIKRINLIERPRFQVTYGAILAAAGVSVLICALFYGGLLWSQAQSKKTVVRLSGEIEQLKKLREKLMASEEIAQQGGAAAEIQLFLKKAPVWPQILETLSSNLPPNVWLSSFKSFDKEGMPPKKTIILNGQSKNPQGLAGFLTALEKSPYLENVGLTTSKEEVGVFNFSATCDIAEGKR